MKYLVEPLLSNTNETLSATQRTFTLASILTGQVVTSGSSTLTTSTWSELDTQKWQLFPGTSSTGSRYHRIGRPGTNMFLTVEGSASTGWTVADRSAPLLTGTMHSGNDQRVPRTGTTVEGGQAYFAPLQVRVCDSFGNPVAGIGVTFAVGTRLSNMAVQIDPAGAASVIVKTDVNGIAKLALMNSKTASVCVYYADSTFSIVASVAGGNQFTFVGTVAPTNPTSYTLTQISGNNQTVVGTASSSTSYSASFAPLKVQLKDSAGNPVAGKTLTWEVTSKPSGTTSKIDPASAVKVTSVTDASGYATLAQVNGASLVLTGNTGPFAVGVYLSSSLNAQFVGMMAAPAVAADSGSEGPQAWTLEQAGTAGMRIKSRLTGGYLQLEPGSATKAPWLSLGRNFGGSGSVEVFVDKDYGGRSAAFGHGRFDKPLLQLGNDSVSSIKVPAGYKATLFTDVGFKSTSRAYVTDFKYLYNFNDTTSGIIVQAYHQTAHTGAPLTATTYGDANYVGDSQHLDIGAYTLSELWVGNDKISSLAVPSGLEVVLCSDDWFRGTQVVYTTSATSLGDMNDKTSSIIVREVSGPTVTVYSGTGFTGTATVLKVGAWMPNATGSFSNTAGSVKIPSNLMVTGFNKSSVLTAPLYGDRSTIPWSSASGSGLIVEPAMPVVFTADGKWQKLRPGCYNSSALTIGATSITRIQVPEGYTAALFTEDGFMGGKCTFEATGPVDLPSDFRGRIRSITVDPIQGCMPQLWRLGRIRSQSELQQPRATVTIDQDGTTLDVLMGTWNGFDFSSGSEGGGTQPGFTEVYVLSVTVPEGYRLTLFSENKLSGNFKAFTSNTTLTSPFLCRSTMLEPVVYLYENADRSGKRVELGVGSFDLGSSSIAFADRASAIRVPLGLNATLFQNSNYTGNSQSFVEDAVLDSVLAKQASSIRVRPFAFPMPRGTMRYGNQVNFKCGDRYLRFNPDTNMIFLSTEAPPTDPEMGNYGDFRVIRAGSTTLPNFLSFGDVVALRTTVGAYYVKVQSDGRLAIGGTNTSDAWPFILVRAGTTSHNQVVSNNDSVALMSTSGRYLTADGSTAPAMARESIGSLERFTFLDASEAPVTACNEESTYIVGAATASGVESNVNVSTVTASDGNLNASCGFNICGTAACGTEMQLTGACPEASYLALFCAGDAAGQLSFGDVVPVSSSSGSQVGLTACGADICGAAVCGAAACGAAACFQEANGISVCGADACYSAACGVAATGVGTNIFAACGAAASGVSAGGVTICGVDACGVDACPIDVCGADACGIDIIPFVPGI